MTAAVGNVIDFAFSAEAETLALPTFREQLDSYTTDRNIGNSRAAASS